MDMQLRTLTSGALEFTRMIAVRALPSMNM
jgi:hypothetical protein